MVAFWKEKGKPERYKTAVLSVLIVLLFTPAGFLLVTFLANPDPTLERLYAMTGITPSPHDARFLQMAFALAFFGMAAWSVWNFRKFLTLAEHRDESQQQPPRSLEQKPEQRYQHASEIKTEVEGIMRGPAVVGEAFSTAPVTWPRTGYLRAVVLPIALLAAFWCMAILAATTSGWLIGGRVGNTLQGEVAGFLLVGGWFLLPVVALILNSIWLFRATVIGGYLQTVVFPMPVFFVIFCVACFAFNRRSGDPALFRGSWPEFTVRPC